MDLSHVTHYVPFAALLTKRPPDLPNRPLITRLIEQGTVGVVTGLVVLYGVSQVQGQKIDDLAKQQVETKAATSADIRDIKEMIVQMQRDLYVPRK